MTDDKNPEVALVAGAERCTAMVRVLHRNGARRNVPKLRELVAELVEVQRLAAEACAGDWVADALLVELATRFDRVAQMLFEEVSPCAPKQF